MSGKSFHNLKRSENAVGGEEAFGGQCDGGGFHYYPVKGAQVVVLFKRLHTNARSMQNNQEAYLVCKCCQCQKPWPEDGVQTI